MKLLQYLLFVLIITICYDTNAQSFGVRAGLNFSTFNGPAENIYESNSTSGGFHFGVNYGHNVSDLFSIVFEIAYTQNGNKFKYSDGGDDNITQNSYFIIRDTDRTIFEPGERDIDLSISNGYLTFPILANYKLSKKWEIFGGVYGNLLVSPTAQGSMVFESSNPIEPEVNHIIFKQSLDYKYGADEALEAKIINGQRDIRVYIDGEQVSIAKTVGAYYQHAEKKADLMNRFDAGLIGGFNYFLNKGFYAGVRLEYGLTDITDDRVDISLESLDENNEVIYRADHDTHLGVNVSIGFRF